MTTATRKTRSSAPPWAAAAMRHLRAAGLSRGKMSYLRDLAEHLRDGKLNFHRFPRMEDEAIIEDLTRVRGIGRWTAEMFLMFNLCRPDVLAVGDLGLRNAATRAYAPRDPVNAEALRELGERWRPYRSAAAWYLWQSMQIVTPDGRPAKSTARPGKTRTAKKPAAKGPAPKTGSRSSKL